MDIELVEILETGNILGENIVWDDRSGDLWWTDIQACQLFCCRAGTQKIEYYALPSRLASFGLTDSVGEFIAAFESGFALLKPASGEIGWIKQPEKNYAGRRFNDGRVDRQGRFWAGTMVEDASLSKSVKGRLYRLDQDAKVETVEGGLGISNGLCWSPDSTIMYLADSAKRTIFAYDFDSETGRVTNKRIFATTPSGIFPDGADVDAHGFMWSAQWGGSRIVRYAPDGSIDHVLSVPVTQPSCIAFGGTGCDKLYVTTAREGLSRDQLACEPEAGNILIYQTDVSGLPAPRFTVTDACRRAESDIHA